jgi:methyl-accepting chemotaxis protein
MQLLGSGATFVNLSLDTSEKLLEIVDKLEKIATKANKGNISGSLGKRMRDEFDLLASEFDKKIEAAKKDDIDLLDVERLKAELSRAGLEPDKISELASSLKRFSHPAEATLNANGEVVSEGNPVPLAEFQRALKSAIVDPDDPTDDRSGFFGRIKKDLQDIKLKLEGNVVALKDTAKLVGENIKLVRAAGLAFLEVSNDMTGLESAEDIASKIRDKIRSAARPLLSEAHNLEPIMVAGLAVLAEKSQG